MVVDSFTHTGKKIKTSLGFAFKLCYRKNIPDSYVLFYSYITTTLESKVARGPVTVQFMSPIYIWRENLGEKVKPRCRKLTSIASPFLY